MMDRLIALYQQLERESKAGLDLARLTRLAPAAICFTNPEGSIRYANHYWHELAGLPDDVVDGFAWREVIHPDDRVALFTDWALASAAGQLFEREFRYLHPDGRTLWVHCRARPAVVEGAFLGHVAVLEDITVGKLAALRLAELGLEVAQVAKGLMLREPEA